MVENNNTVDERRQKISLLWQELKRKTEDEA
jgi:hypothetical protein